MYKFKIGENARRQQGECPLCLKRNVSWTELREWGMCGACYAVLLEEVIENIVKDSLKADADHHAYINAQIQVVLDKHKIKREKTEPGWVPGMD
jgi:hypothetical protein